jgi:hypothetical protein
MSIRVERGKTANIDQSFYVDGVLTDASGAVTVDVVRADGSALATGAATTHVSTGVYRYALPAQSALNLLTLTYTGTWSSSVQTETQQVELVGDFYFSIPEARAADSALADATVYPNATIIAARAEVEDEFEQVTNVAWVLRFARERLDGSWLREMAVDQFYPRTVLSLVVDGHPYNSTELAEIIPEDHGAFARTNFATVATSVSPKNVVVEYEYGKDRPPADLKRAALVRLRYNLTAARSAIPDRATSYVADGGGNFQIATPGQRGSITGIPSVDVVLWRYQQFGQA